MALRGLLEPDCQGANSLMRLGSHIRQDAAFKDEGLGPSTTFINRSDPFSSDQEFVQEFLGQIAPPQTFRMDALLKEMREIEAQSFQHRLAPPVIDEVNNGIVWANEFSYQPPVDSFASIENSRLNEIWNQSTPHSSLGMNQTFSDKPWNSEFFDESLQQMVSNQLKKKVNF